MRRREAAQELDGRLCRDVAGVRLDAETARLEERPERCRQQRRVGARAEALQHAEFTLQDGARPVIAAGGELGCEDAALGSAAEMKPLDHATLSAPGERQETAAAGSGDAVPSAKASSAGDSAS